jgi:hypothetical protein
LAIRVPRLSYVDLRGYADRFLGEHHPTLSPPVPIDEIAEFGLGINIIPIPGLQAVHDIDGFLSADMTEISVDQYVFENRPTRYRFTLAHEIAHLVIHGDRLREVAPKSIPDWKQFVRDLPERDYAWLEWQAYAFAGLVLAPQAPLRAAHDDAVQATRDAGIDPGLNLDFARDYIATWIARRFEVSAAVIDKRLVYDGIWPRVG